MKMNAAVLYGKEDIRFAEIERPKPKEKEVLVKVVVSGICGSDVPRVFGDEAHFYPIVLGHEFSGKIVEVGEKVTKVKIGDKVAGSPLVPCHECRSCKQGDHALCKKYSFVGSRQNGSFAEYVCIPEQNVVVLGEGVSYEEGAFFEPSAVALHALRRLKYKGGKKVAILGAGTIGIFTMQWAKIFGAKEVFVFDIDETRLKLARDMGAEKTLNIHTEEAEKILQQILEEGGFDYIYEAAGDTETMKLAFKLAGNKSQVCFIGTPTNELVFSHKEFEQINRKEFILTGSWMSYSAPFPGDEWILTAHYFSTGQLKILDRMILKKFPLTKVKEAFDLFKNPKGVGGKIFLLCSEETEVLDPLKKIVESQKKGLAQGICSVCSTNEFVLEATIQKAKENDSFILIEPTPNQVNQHRGYSGMTPMEFKNYVKDLAEKYSFDKGKIILGGDHLGPLIWKHKPAEEAMKEAEELVKQFVLAGYNKLHIDTTMKLADDNKFIPLSKNVVAKRSARLIKKAEETFKELKNNPKKINPPRYIIGSEVPTPGGKENNEKESEITNEEDFKEIVDKLHLFLEKEGLEETKNRIVGVVIQTGAEFGDKEVVEYNREKIKILKQKLNEFKGVVFEGHSTDYQKKEKLKEMVEDGIAILKVGPELTFEMRQTLYILEDIEKELLKNNPAKLSNFTKTLEEEMILNPKYWKNNHQIAGLDEAKSVIKTGLSDRARYYLDFPRVKNSISKLLFNLENSKISKETIKKFFPEENFSDCIGPKEIIYERIKKVLEKYFDATNQKLISSIY